MLLTSPATATVEPATPATPQEPEAEPAETTLAELRLSFTEGPGKFEMLTVYACPEDCLVRRKNEPFPGVHSGKYVDSATKPDAEGAWVLNVPDQDTYYLALELIKPDNYRTIGYLKVGDDTPLVTTLESEALEATVTGNTDLGEFTIYEKGDRPVPGRLASANKLILDDEYFFVDIVARKMPPGTKLVTVYRTCDGKTHRLISKTNAKGSATSGLDVMIPDVARKFSWITTATHPDYEKRVVRDGVEFPKKFKAGC